MRILVAMPHYFGEGDLGSPNLSTKPAARRSRVDALAFAILALHQQFGPARFGLDHHLKHALQPADAARSHIDVVICTTGNAHLLGEIPKIQSQFRHHTTAAEPRLLGFECHKLMRDHQGQYDYYAYVEDDIAITDPSFFRKRRLFDRRFRAESLLAPNRYELSPQGRALKLYVDYRVHRGITERYQNIDDVPSLSLPYGDDTIQFERTPYPSSGSFFLNEEQLAFWLNGPHFLDGDLSYLSPLDSAATLSVMKTFRIYKPVLANAWFLELIHLSPRWIGRIEDQITYQPFGG